ncbi:MAG: multiprotein-bridging factor 1 family protein [Candidatus Marsarchaeota archaeon]|jgi:putative transcription factor|nr:multiprotein-bridging factor 1 family protein [Candidatus Marsarchaeota archaeon]MCL5419747.1 multiprotein-bridging factor 1 family protein [Candidatus Marsarchaeota archaeon]
MNDCDVCGRPAGTVYVVRIEGALMNLCERCARGKHPEQVIHGEGRMGEPQGRKPDAAEPEIVADYGRRIRQAREAVGISAKVLAEKISEKESTLVRVEKQETLPSETLRKKLEKELGIRLLEQASDAGVNSRISHNEPLSLWDAAVKKKKGE